MPDIPRRSTKIAIACLVALATAASYASILRADFITFDDPVYVVNNDTVRAGLGLDGIVWAFRTGHASNWHPLTWISHMLDVSVFGLDPRGHHATNVLLHVASSLLLLAALDRMTRAFWPSALVAALFALHPTHVESVAWIAERKDVLSAFFAMATLLAYARHAERPRRGTYLAVLGLYALGLMSKPMLVTLPCAMLLLDYWPLGRMRAGAVGALVKEKIPLLALAAGASIATFAVQHGAGAVAPTEVLTPAVRASNALVSYLRYLGKTFWPTDLAAYYPHPRSVELVPVAAAILVLALVSWLAVRERARRPWLLVGWLWYLGTLVPVIGFVQVGAQAMADRYTYIPTIGIFVALAWWARAFPRVSAVVAIPVLLALAATTRHQVGYWRDTHTLFEHTVAITPDNSLARHCLGNALIVERDLDGAIAQLEEAVRITPNFADARTSLGTAFGAKGKFEDALVQFQEALRWQPRSTDALYNVGFALANLNRVDEAIVAYGKVLEIDPDHYAANSKIGIVLGNRGRLDEALVHLRRAIERRPDDADTRYWTAVTLQLQGKTGEALAEYEEALRTRSDDVQTINNVAWIRATSVDPALRDGVEAVRLAQRAIELADEENPVLLDTLAAAYAEAGRFEDAVLTCEQAIALATKSGAERDAARFREQLELFRARQPFRIR